MEPDKQRILTEKISYLITNELRENKFDVLAIDIDFSIEMLESSEKYVIDSYDIFIDVDYNGALDGYDPYLFASHLKFLCEKAYDSVSKYVITPQGKITSDKGNNIVVHEGMILKIDYVIEETHKFNLTFKVSYYE